MTGTKPRIRQGIIIGKAELKDSFKRRELVSVLICMHEYIGYVDIFDETARLYVFSSDAGACKALREAKKMGYRTAGRVDEQIFIRNSDLNRPHLNRLRGYEFQREYYK